MRIIKFLRRQKQKQNLKKLKKLGDNTNIELDVRFLNPKYISIENDSYIASFGAIEAWDKYNDKCYAPEIRIGRNVLINQYCHIGAINCVEIGDGCLLGSRVTILDHSHGKNIRSELDIHPAKRDLYSKGPIKIGNRVWLCENVVVLPGVTIGDNTIIGANSVVTSDIPANCVAAGTPAKVVKKM